MDIISGVYKISSISNRNFYIGSSINIHKRWYRHKLSLKNNKHHSIRMQRIFNKYGADDFIFEIIETCDSKNIISREQFYLDLLSPKFNSCRFAYSKKGVDPWNKNKVGLQTAWNKGLKMPEEQRLKMIGHKSSDKVLKLLDKTGTKQSYETIQKRKDALYVPISKYTKDDVFICSYNSFIEAELDGFCRSNISECCRGIRKSAGGYKWKYNNK